MRVRRVIAAGYRIGAQALSLRGRARALEGQRLRLPGLGLYTLYGGGLLRRSLSSSGLMGWGRSGRGRWITIYAGPGLFYMVVKRPPLRHNGAREDRIALAARRAQQRRTRGAPPGRAMTGEPVRYPACVPQPPPPQQPSWAIAAPASLTNRRWPADELGTKKVESMRSVSSAPQAGHGGGGASERTSSSKRSSQATQA
jgi:hypothetical protein